MRAILTMGDFISQREVPSQMGHPQPEFRVALYERLNHFEREALAAATLKIKYLVFDLKGVVGDTAFYEFSRIVG